MSLLQLFRPSAFTPPPAPTEVGRPSGDLIIPRLPRNWELDQRRGITFEFEFGTQAFALGADLGSSRFLLGPALGPSAIRTSVDMRMRGIELARLETGEARVGRWFDDEVAEIVRWLLLEGEYWGP